MFTRLRAFSALLISLFLLVAVSANAAAVDQVVTPTNVSSGDTVTARQSLDPAGVSNPFYTNVVKINGSQQRYLPGSAAAPANSKIEFSEDGVTYGLAESTATRFVRFSGPAASGAGSVAPIGAAYDQPIVGASGGDGFAAYVTGNRVYNVNHHLGLRVECHELSDGSVCDGYPWVYPDQGGASIITGYASVTPIDQATGKMWVAGQKAGPAGTELGFACILVGQDSATTPTDCGWVTTGTAVNGAAGAFPTNVSTYGGSMHSGDAFDGKVYAIDSRGKVHCVVMASGTPCIGQPFSIGLPASDPTGTQLNRIPGTSRFIVRVNPPITYTDLTFLGFGRVPTGITGPSSVQCFDAATNAVCAGWSPTPIQVGDAGGQGGSILGFNFNWGNTINGAVIPIQTAVGAFDGFCAAVDTNLPGANIGTPTLDIRCRSLADGSVVPAPAAMAGTGLTNGETGWQHGVGGVGLVAAHGTRAWFTMSRFTGTRPPSLPVNITMQRDDRLICFDFSKPNGGAECDNWPSDFDASTPENTTSKTYATTLDPTGTCVWTLGDTGIMLSRDATDPTRPCRNATAGQLVDRADSYCGEVPAGADGAWGRISIRNVAAGSFVDAFVTVQDANGAIIPGFDLRKLTAAEVANGVDISSIPYSGSTTKLRVSVQFTGVDGVLSDPPSSYIETSWESTVAPRTCLKTTVEPINCPTATEAMSIDTDVAFASAQGGASMTASDSDSLSRQGEIDAECATVKLDKVWRGSAGLATLAIRGGDTDVSVQTGSGGAAPQTTGTIVVNPGSHTVSESGNLADYDATLTCTKNGLPYSPMGNVLMTIGGDDVVCTYTNTRKAKITVKKVVSNPDSSNPVFDFSSSLPDTAASAGNQAIGGGKFSIGSGQQVSTSVTGGSSHTVSENDPSGIDPGYKLASVNCVDALGADGATIGYDGSEASIETKPGSDVTCTYTNKRLAPMVVVVKRPKLQKVHIEDTATYEYEVRNNGTSDLRDVVVTDDKCSPVTLKSKNGDTTPDVLNADTDEVWTYTCSIPAAQLFAASKDPVVNTVTVKAKDELGRDVPEATDTAQTVLLEPAIKVVKSPKKQAVYRDQTATYTYDVTNVGTADLTEINVADDKCSPLTLKSKNGDATPDTLNVGGTERWTYECSVPAASLFPTDNSPAVINTVTASGRDELGKEVSSTDKAETVLLVPGIALVKTVDAASQNPKAGDAVKFNIAVTNIGNTSMTTVAVTDDMCATNLSAPDKTGDQTPDQLDPTETWRYTCVVQTTAAQAGQTILNKAGVVGTDTGGRKVTADGAASVNLPAAGGAGTNGSGEPVPTPKPTVVGRSRLVATTGCVSAKYAVARVNGSNIQRVVFYVDGRKVKTIARPNSGKTGYKISVPAKRLGYGSHSVRAQVTYVAGAKPATRTHRSEFQRCRPRVVIRPRTVG